MLSFRSLTASALAAVIVALPMASDAAGYHGEFWDATSSFASIDAALGFAASNAATGTFLSTAVDYPAGNPGSVGNATSLSSFLGVDFASYVGAIPASLSHSVFRVSGTFLPGAGLKTFTVGSDDGFSLLLNGTEVSRQSAPRSFGYTSVDVDAGPGPVEFVLTYYENGGSTGVEFKIGGANGTVVDSSIEAAHVPLPAALPLLMAAVGALALHGRRRNAA